MAIAETMHEPRLVQIPGDAARRVAPLIRDRLASICERSGGSVTPESLLAQVESGRWQLWVIDDGRAVAAVLITELMIQPSGRKTCAVVALTGSDSLSWLHLLDDLDAWARSEGCTHMQAMARRGWARRMPQWKMTHVMLERSL